MENGRKLAKNIRMIALVKLRRRRRIVLPSWGRLQSTHSNCAESGLELKKDHPCEEPTVSFNCDRGALAELIVGACKLHVPAVDSARAFYVHRSRRQRYIHRFVANVPMVTRFCELHLVLTCLSRNSRGSEGRWLRNASPVMQTLVALE